MSILFLQGKIPKGSPGGTGAVAKGAAGYNQSAGALGLGSRAASKLPFLHWRFYTEQGLILTSNCLDLIAAVTESFTFLAYTIPILGGIISDTKWGRFKVRSEEYTYRQAIY
jgi:POT family proton-dependent oligopeptide transporter